MPVAATDAGDRHHRYDRASEAACDAYLPHTFPSPATEGNSDGKT